MNRLCDKKASEKGLGMVEAMVALGILSVVMVGVSKFFSESYVHQKNLTAVGARDGKIALTINLLEANAPRILNVGIDPQQGAKFCAPLAQCVKSISSCSTQASSCAFYDLSGLQITGSDSSPMRIGLDGEPCQSASPNCPFEIVGRFRKSTSAAGTIELWPVVRQATGVAISGVVRLDGYNDKPNVAPKVVRVLVNRIEAACPPTEKLMGYKPDGSMDCQSIITSKKAISLSPLAAAPVNALMCPDGLYMRGITKEGQPICSSYPHVWSYYNTVLCFDGVPNGGESCNKVMSENGNECPDNPHGTICDLATLPSPFCYKKYGPWIYAGVPNQPNEVSLNIPLQKSTVSLGSYVMGCSGGQSPNAVNCYYGNMNAPSVSAGQVTVPQASTSVIRLMRCMQPIRAAGSAF